MDQERDTSSNTGLLDSLQAFAQQKNQAGQKKTGTSAAAGKGTSPARRRKATAARKKAASALDTTLAMKVQSGSKTAARNSRNGSGRTRPKKLSKPAVRNNPDNVRSDVQKVDQTSLLDSLKSATDAGGSHSVIETRNTPLNNHEFTQAPENRENSGNIQTETPVQDQNPEMVERIQTSTSQTDPGSESGKSKTGIPEFSEKKTENMGKERPAAEHAIQKDHPQSSSNADSDFSSMQSQFQARLQAQSSSEIQSGQTDQDLNPDQSRKTDSPDLQQPAAAPDAELDEQLKNADESLNQEHSQTDSLPDEEEESSGLQKKIKVSFLDRLKKQNERDEEQLEEQEQQENSQEEDWTEQLQKFYSTRPSIWLRPWIYILLVAAGFVIWAVSRMSSLGLYEFSYVAMAMGIGALVLGIAGYLFFFQRKLVFKVLAIVLCVVVGGFSFTQVRANDEMASDVHKMANPNTPVSISAAVYYLQQAPVTSVESLEATNAVVGILEKNKTINDQIIDALKARGVTIETRTFDSFSDMLKALKGQAIRAVILTGTDPLLASEFPGLENTKKELAILESFPDTSALYNTGSTLNPAQEPFVMLMSAQMDPLNVPDARSAVNLVVAVNPLTHTTLKVFVPRSLKLPMICQDGLGCLPDTEDKVSLTSFHSILALKDTLASALDTRIDFTMNVDLEWLIMGLPGQETIPLQRMSGFGALEYRQEQKDLNGILARKLITEVEDFSETDTDYEISQLDVLMYILHSYMQKGTSDLEAVLNDMAQCVSTSFTYEQLLKLIQMFALHDYVWNTYDYGISGTDVWETSPSLESKAYMITPDEEALSQAAMDIKAVLAGETPQFAITDQERAGDVDVEDASAPADQSESKSQSDDSATSQNDQAEQDQQDSQSDAASSEESQEQVDADEEVQADSSVQDDSQYDSDLNSDPAYTDPGYVDPGYVDPGYVDPGYYDPNYYDPYAGAPAYDPYAGYYDPNAGAYYDPYTGAYYGQ